MTASSPGDPGRPARPPEPAAQQPDPAAEPELDVVILAGGRGQRLGGVDKPGLVVGTATMVGTVARAAVAAGARRVILVGPARGDVLAAGHEPPGGLAVVREEPPGAGPVPALRAGLAEVGAPWLALLAADLPFLRAEHIRALLAVAARPGPGPATAAAGAVLADSDGRPQWLLGCWATARLRAALAGYAGGSLRGVLGPLRPRLLGAAAPDGSPPPWLDCDTPADLAAARAWPRPASPAPAPESRPAGRAAGAAWRPPPDPPTDRRDRS
jgi:molybdenum cofactor guanylyltransferase